MVFIYIFMFIFLVLPVIYTVRNISFLFSVSADSPERHKFDFRVMIFGPVFTVLLFLFVFLFDYILGFLLATNLLLSFFLTFIGWVGFIALRLPISMSSPAAIAFCIAYVIIGVILNAVYSIILLKIFMPGGFYPGAFFALLYPVNFTLCAARLLIRRFTGEQFLSPPESPFDE